MRSSSRILSRALFLILASLPICACSSAATNPSTSGGKSAGGAVPAAGSSVATIDGQPVTLVQLDERVARQLYEVRQRALEEMIADQLIEKEAKAQGLTKEALIQKEVTAKIAEPTDAEVDQVWEANKARLTGKTKEEVAPDIKNWLKNQKGPALEQSFLQGLRTKYKVQVLLEPPRVEVSVDDDPAKGPASAPVTIVEFSDFQCPFCSRVEGTIKQVMEKYPGKIKFVYRDFPLSIHALAPKAAEAAQCAHEQGKFWEYHDALYSDQSKLSPADLEATATRLGLKAEDFKKCLDSGKFAAEVGKDMADANRLGVSSTPYFFINGIAVVGAQGLPAFTDVIDKELAKASK